MGKPMHRENHIKNECVRCEILDIIKDINKLYEELHNAVHDSDNTHKLCKNCLNLLLSNNSLPCSICNK